MTYKYYKDNNGGFITVKEGSVKQTYVFFRLPKNNPASRGNRIRTRPMIYYKCKKEAFRALEMYAKSRGWRSLGKTLPPPSVKPLSYPKHLPLFSFFDKPSVTKPLFSKNVVADRPLCLRYVNYLRLILAGEFTGVKFTLEDLFKRICDESYQLALETGNQGEGKIFTLGELDVLRLKFIYNKRLRCYHKYQNTYVGEYRIF